MSAAQAAAETVAEQIGAFADKKADAAHKAAENETDLALKAQYLQEAKNWSEGGDSRTAMHAAGGALTGGLTAGGLSSVGGALGAGLSAKLAPELSEVARVIRDAGPTGNENVDALLGNLAANVLAGGAGAVVGGASGAMTGAATERFNRQLHPEEKSLAKKIATDAKARGITNSDGSPITAAQVENAMRSADNSQYGETIKTGMVVPLNANTKAGDVYDTTGMKIVSDGAGNNYLVQDPSMLSSASDALRGLIRQNTGGANSPYSWNVLSPEAGQAGVSSVTNSSSPFAPGWNTGEYSAGLGVGGRGILPDYGTVSGGALSGTASGSMSFYDGSTYLSGGVAQTNPSSVSWKPGLGVTVGWIFGVDNAKEARDFLSGSGNQGFVSIPMPFKFNVNGAITHAYGGKTGLELGIGAPGPVTYGVVPWGHSTQVTGPSK
jgi:filamentous hemagglutinin